VTGSGAARTARANAPPCNIQKENIQKEIAVHPKALARHEASTSILIVAKDIGGRWLVQEGLGRMRRRFASLEAAVRFALRGRHAFSGAAVAISCGPTPPEPGTAGFHASRSTE
jgi:hypothetical protein